MVMVCGCSAEPIAVVPPEPQRVAAAEPSLVMREQAPLPPPLPLTIEFLGVGGFLLERGGEQVMTPPLFTRPSLLQVNTGGEVHPDAAAIAARFPRQRLFGLKAVLAGHAHYDHLLDAAFVPANAPAPPVFYGNQSMKNLLAALSPERPPGCPAAGPRPVSIAAGRVVSLEAVADYRLCPSQRPAGAPLEGSWVHVPDSHIRVMALCSEHPDQFGPIHFAPGGVDTAQCELPEHADAWKEGRTLAYLVDFLDPFTGAPAMRVYYQDSPGNGPVGWVPPELLAEKRVDVALLCVGNYDKVPDEPTRTLGAMGPRFALGGHWEDFFQPYEQEPTGIPFLDVQRWAARARAALAGGEAAPLERDGAVLAERALLPMPGDVFTVSPAR